MNDLLTMQIQWILQHNTNMKPGITVNESICSRDTDHLTKLLATEFTQSRIVGLWWKLFQNDLEGRPLGFRF
jgi:hypothetical protein